MDHVVTGESLKKVSKTTGVFRTSLRRYAQDPTSKGVDNTIYKKTFTNRQVFTSGQEKMLEDYLVNAAKMNHGLTKMMMREFS